MSHRSTRSKALLTGAGLVLLAGSIPAVSVASSGSAPGRAGPDSITLTGVIRDFKTEHPDFETYPGHLFRGWNSAGGVYEGLVAEQLDEDGKPAFNEELLEDRGWSDIPLTSRESLAQWFRDVPGVNTSWTHDIVLERDGNIYRFAREKPQYFFPADNTGFGNSEGPLRWARPGSRNFHFTYELETEFRYTDPGSRDFDLEFTFTGDDDVWVFINDRLAVDIGGVHGQAQRSINVDDAAERLGLEPGNSYSLKLFFAERHTSESNFCIETTLELRPAELPTTAHLFD